MFTESKPWDWMDKGSLQYPSFKLSLDYAGRLLFHLYDGSLESTPLINNGSNYFLEKEIIFKSYTVYICCLKLKVSNTISSFVLMPYKSNLEP